MTLAAFEPGNPEIKCRIPPRDRWGEIQSGRIRERERERERERGGEEEARGEKFSFIRSVT
jgi:hypothetical protein